ncbi:hypothetical protein LUZ60_000017 [Juncus effusus]|nr:hypothetical protein LUZ60_000017 [Juncus effusus]
MASDAAEPAKALLPYLQRADELQKHEPLVAYYCRLYAMERGLVIPQKDRTKTTNSLLISLMNQLEKDKKTLKLSSDDNLYLEGFASNVFAKADKIDRAGRADLNTAKTFYAASIFYEIINQFGELPAELEQKQKYAAWKAADIRKAIKEGRKPEPGPPGGEKDEQNTTMPSLSPSNSLDLGRSQSFSNTPPPQNFDNPSPAKDLDRRQSFSSSYNTPPTDHTPTHYTPPTDHTHYNTPDKSPTQHTQTTHYTPDIPPTQHTPTHYTPENQPTQHTPENQHTQHTPTQYTPPPYTVPSNSNSNYPSNSSTDPSNYPQNYPTEQTFYPTDPSNYPNFQSYPSFQDTTLPSVPIHQPSFSYPDSPSQFQNVFANQQPPAVQNVPTVPPPVQRAEPVPVAENYRYDSSYQPSVEKISEAHKAARFAVGALAFDDVAIAVDHLKRALDLLTNQSAKTH